MLDLAKLNFILQKTAFAPPVDPATMGAPMPPQPGAPGGISPDQLMAAAGMMPAPAAGGAPMAPPPGMPPMDPAAMGGAPMDPAAMGGMPPTGPDPAQVGQMAGEPKVGDLTVQDLQMIVGDIVSQIMESYKGAQEQSDSQIAELQNEIAALKSKGGAIPRDKPSMPAPEMPSEDAVVPEEEAMPEELMPKTASVLRAEDEEKNRKILLSLQRMRTMR